MSPAAPTVTVNGCTILGKAQPKSEQYPKAIDSFFGIPYARAERFAPAVPVQPPPSQTIDATTPGATLPCPLAPGETAENPLTLSIIRPSVSSASSGETSTLLPVVVYVHGGGFNFGQPLERDLAAFVAWGQKDVLVVGISYRLGVLGFLAGREGEFEDEEAKELNLGLRDQRVAVEWVRRWVAPFGGDGEDITLMGTSAGAHSIGHHILNPTRLPFRKAILESGSPTARSILSPSHPRALAQFQDLKDQIPTRSSLRRLPVEDLLQAAVMVWADHAPSVCWPFQPVIDGPGGAIPDLPLNLWDDLIRSGKAADVAVLAGFCSHEGTSFVSQRAKTNAEFRSFFATLIPGLSPADLDALEALYPDPTTDPASPYHNFPTAVGPSRQGAQFHRLHAAYAHYAYICPVLHTAHKLAAAGARVYVYEYAALGAPFRAASHGDQASVVAHDPKALAFRPGLAAVAKEMNARWTAFAAAADGDVGDAWPAFASPFEGGAGEVLVFGEGNDEAAGGKETGTPVRKRVVTEREMAQCRFWWERMELSQGMGERDGARVKT